MKQEAEKIYNIEHVDNVHIDAPGLFETAEKLNQAIESIPGLIERTIAMFLSKSAPDKLRDDTIIKDSYGVIAPVSLKSKRPDSFNPGDIVMSHWQIDRCIGKGSFGSVYEAHHTGHSNLYRSAIKVINSALISSPIAKNDDISLPTFNASYMIQQELDNMVELRGTGYIVDYEDHETVTYSDGSWGIVIRMELLEPLSNIIHTKTTSREDAIRLGIDICKALDFCNRSNIIHRDVKPSNIFLSKWGGYKLGDFSASAKIGEQHDLDQIGTLRYMAPEVYQGKAFSPNIDTYSLGLTMYELLKVNRIKSNASLASREAALSQRLSGKPLPPIPGIDNALQSVIFKACAYNPEDRFSSPTEMMNELLKLELRSKR